MGKHYKKTNINSIAEKLDRCRSPIYQRTNKLGLTTQRKCVSDKQVIASIKKFHPKGWSDNENSNSLGKQLGCQVNRHRVSKLRRSLGLDHNALSEHRIEQIRQKTKEQIAKKRMKSLAMERVAAFDRWKESTGWPTDLTIRAVESLEMFYQYEALTRLQLCALIGIKHKKRTEPVSNAKGGTVLDELQRAGLATRLPMAVDSGRIDKRGYKILIDLDFINPVIQPDASKRTIETAAQQSKNRRCVKSSA